MNEEVHLSGNGMSACAAKPAPGGGKPNRPWKKPQLKLLPVDQTASSHFPGTDGGGPNTSETDGS